MKRLPFFFGLSKAAPTISKYCRWMGCMLVILMTGCVNDNTEELLDRFFEQDSLQNKIPTISIIRPNDGDTVLQPLVFNYKIENWGVMEGDRHLQYFVNGENKGLIFNSREALIQKVDTGNNVIQLRLAQTNYRTIQVWDEVMLYVKPLPEDFFQLIINKGVGSGAFKEGELIAIAADDPDRFYRFKEWVGDTADLNGNFPLTSLIMPKSDVSLTATYEEIPIEYLKDVSKIIRANCLQCHSGINTPDLSTCENLAINSSDVAIKIVDQADPMPPTGLMRAEHIETIERWINQGTICN